MKKDTIVEIISALLIFLFIYASLTKLFDYRSFRLQLSKSPFVNSFASIIAWSLPASELIISFFLVFKQTRRMGLYASLFLMTFFAAYIYTMLHFSYYLPCSCGGILALMSWSQHMVFNVVFVILSIVGICIIEKQRIPLSKQTVKIK